MSKTTFGNNSKLTKEQVLLVAVLLAFVLLLFFIWLWYDVQIKSLPIKHALLNI